jgi:hypothetical protein
MKLELERYKNIFSNTRNPGVDHTQFDKPVVRANASESVNENASSHSPYKGISHRDERRDYTSPDRTVNVKARKYNSAKRNNASERSPPSCLKP